MTTEGDKPQQTAAPDGVENGEQSVAAPPHPWEAELDVYPLRAGTEDPRWAVRTVWVWTGIALFSLAFILALFILGFFH
jgi:hypothetical protein